MHRAFTAIEADRAYLSGIFYVTNTVYVANSSY